MRMSLLLLSMISYNAWMVGKSEITRLPDQKEE